MSSTETAQEPEPSKAHRWFLAGAQVLAKLAPELPEGEWYACPLCQTFFTIDELDTKNLTKEQVPPRSIGGREMVLTCRQCNNRAGATFDAHMERAEAFRRFGSDEPLRQLDITLTVAGIPNRGSMYAGPAGILMFGNPKQNHPDDVAKITESFADLVNAGHQMQVAFRDTFHPRTAQLGFLRAASPPPYPCPLTTFLSGTPPPFPLYCPRPSLLAPSPAARARPRWSSAPTIPHFLPRLLSPSSSCAMFAAVVPPMFLPFPLLCMR